MQQELAESIDRPVGFAVRNIAEIAFWIHAVPFARPIQAVQQCYPLTILVRAEEQKVLRSNQSMLRAFSAILLSASVQLSFLFF
ncbi:hypothetical protein ABFP38_003576 [Enterobacter hormaechei]